MNKGFWWWRPERNCPFLSARPDERIKWNKFVKVWRGFFCLRVRFIFFFVVLLLLLLLLLLLFLMARQPYLFSFSRLHDLTQTHHTL
jgi:hypothetical protein